jgi:hypothetical protein
MRSRKRDVLRGARVEAAVFVVLAVWAFLPLAILFLRVSGFGISVRHGQGVFVGSTGPQVADHLQYMAWIRDSARHVLIANRFDVVRDPHVFFHPLFALSGLVSKVVSLRLAAIMWKPFTLVAVFLGYLAYVRRLVAGRAAQVVALVLALFFFTPATPLAQWLGIGGPTFQFGTKLMGLEMFPAGYLWGGYPGVFSVALMPVFLLGAERILVPSRRAAGRSNRWYIFWTGVAGLFTSWFHPWQGMTLLVIVGAYIAWDRFDRRSLALVVPVALTVTPLAYYFALSHTHSAWAAVSAPHAGYHHVGAWLVVGLAPAVLALPGIPGRNLDVQERFVRLWPVAALVVYFGLRQSWFYHAFVGISLPLAILGVRGWARLRLPRVVAPAVVLALTVPGMVFAVQWFETTRRDHFLADGERHALAYLDHSPRPGAVMAPLWLGQAVPAFADRNTWLGHYTWTPNYGQRLAQAESLFSGRFSANEARDLVRGVGPAFVASDCRHRADLTTLLGSLVTEVHRFGCATVYEVRASRV